MLLIILVVEMENGLPHQKQAQALRGGISVPNDFLCPLSLELMSDPVIIASGKTYERKHIQHWLEQGNTTCPQTREVLNHCKLVPNDGVKVRIANWCKTNFTSLQQLAKHETCASQVMLSKKIDSNSHQVVQIASRSCINQDVAGTRSTSGRSVRTLRTRACENFDISKREIGQVLENMEGIKAYLHVNQKPEHVGDKNGMCGQGLKNSISNANYRNDAEVPTYNVDDNNLPASQLLNDSSPHNIALPEGLERMAISSDHTCHNELDSNKRITRRISASHRRNTGKDLIIPPSGSDTAENDISKIQLQVEEMVEDLQSAVPDVQRHAAAELRQLAKCNVQSRIIIANAGAIRPLVSLLRSTDSQIQENAVTALLNLSINDNNKVEIAAANVFDPLISVLREGTSRAKENAAATLYSLSIVNENRMVIGKSGGIEALVDLLTHGTAQGKKDAASALYNLSTLDENKPRIVQANAIKPLVKLISDPAAGMIDKAVAIVSNLATIQAGRVSINEEEGIPALVEVVESGSQRGKEKAVATLLHLCTNSSRLRAKVLYEGVIPALVALTNSGTARAQEKASALLHHLKDRQEQKNAILGRGVPSKLR